MFYRTTCRNRFYISGTAGPITIKIGILLQSGQKNSFHKSVRVRLCTWARADSDAMYMSRTAGPIALKVGMSSETGQKGGLYVQVRDGATLHMRTGRLHLKISNTEYRLSSTAGSPKTKAGMPSVSCQEGGVLKSKVSGRTTLHARTCKRRL